jgi:GNAT superfamily N-acetyltransferase
MAATEPAVIAKLDAGDAIAGLALSTEAQWNQNEADWRFFLTQGTVFGSRGGDGRLIATSALLPYTSGNAWISMVLVTANWRRRGLATSLVDACLDAARKQGLTSWLDATPAGAGVYGPLGFTPSLQLRRLRLERPAAAETKLLQTLAIGDLERLILNDRRTMGFDRSTLLTELAGRSGSLLLSSGDAITLVRDGRKARHIGPLFAGDTRQVLTMVHEITGAEAGPFLIDAVSTRDEFLKGLTDTGWTIERPFQRMRFGRATTPTRELPFAVVGPEFG